MTGVCWHRGREKWEIKWINPVNKKRSGFCRCHSFEDACAAREQAQKKEGDRKGTFSPGELVFDKHGHAKVACGKCRCTKCITSYAPNPLSRKKAFAHFKEACKEMNGDDEEKAKRAGERLRVVPSGFNNGAIRRSWCRSCRDIAHKSKMYGPDSAIAKCVAARNAIQADMAKKGCSQCIETREECLECEHVDRKGKPVGCISIQKCEWFANKYKHKGPAEMWKAYQHPSVIVLCNCCHLLQPTFGHERTSTRTATKEMLRQHNNKRKREFVNVTEYGQRLPPGQCLYCGEEYICTEGYERSFHWMHKKDELKNFKISDVVRKASKKGIRIIDAEIDGTNGSGGCALGCANCHYIHETLPRSKEGSEKWDALMQTPVVKRFAQDK